MDLEDLVEYLLGKAEVIESTPFGPEVFVYKVVDKVFAIVSPDDVPPRVNLKCDPAKALELRDEHEAVVPGYHMNKKHWNTVMIDGSLSSQQVMEMVDDSYRLVAKGLKKADRDRVLGG